MRGESPPLAPSEYWGIERVMAYLGCHRQFLYDTRCAKRAWLAREEEQARKERAAELRRGRSREQAKALAEGLVDIEKVEVVDVDPFIGPPESWPTRAPDWYMERYGRQR
jgi:hypothetical protein